MPRKVSKGTGSVEYVYLASGAKLAKKVNGVFTQFYNGSVVYKGDKIAEYISTSEGLAMKTASGFAYQYNLSDHLGNVRVVLNQDKSVAQSTNYYPFGLAHATSALEKNKCLYNGKEIQSDVIGGTAFGMLDYGARFYDPIIGRWHSIDPLAGKYAGLSGYNYVGNNPIRKIDPNGKDGWDVVEGVVRGLYDNATGANSREDYNPTSPEDYNRTLDRIDATSVAVGLIMSDVGVSTAIGDVAASPATGGLSLIATGVGVAVATEGTYLISNAIKNFAKGNNVGRGKEPSQENTGGDKQEYKTPKSGVSGKDGAKNIPSWANGERPLRNESGKDFATRLLDAKYGKGNYKTGPDSEHNKIKKMG